MFKLWTVVLVAVMMVVPMGCGKDNGAGGGTTPPVIKKLTPEQITKLCNDGGQAVALTWVAAEKPTADQVKSVKFVLGAISDAMVNYKGEGFIGMLPEIDVAINKAFPGTDERSIALRKLSHLLASNALVNLDNLFYGHPDWSKKGTEAAGYVNAFTTGANTALDDFVKRSSK